MAKGKKTPSAAQKNAGAKMKAAWALVKSGQAKNITEALRTVWGK